MQGLKRFSLFGGGLVRSALVGSVHRVPRSAPVALPTRRLFSNDVFGSVAPKSTPAQASSGSGSRSFLTPLLTIGASLYGVHYALGGNESLWAVNHIPQYTEESESQNDAGDDSTSTAAADSAAIVVSAATAASVVSASASAPAPAAPVVPELPPVLFDPSPSFKYVLIGAGTATHAALRAIRSIDTDGAILVVSQESTTPYMRPPLSKELWLSADPSRSAALRFTGWDGRDASLHYTGYETPIPNVTFAHGVSVTAMNVADRTVTIEPLVKSSASSTPANQATAAVVVSYERCLIATGGSPRVVPGADAPELRDRVTVFRTVDDFQALYARVRSGSVRSVAIVGGSFLATELACGVAAVLPKSSSSSSSSSVDGSSGSQSGVTQVFPEPSIMARNFPRYLSEYTNDLLVQTCGVKLVPSAYARSVSHAAESGRVAVHLDNGEVLEADHVVLAIGIDANTRFAEQAGLEVDRVSGGIVVNAELEARNNIWAAGDVANYHDIVLGRRRVEHHDHALKSGEVAGLNMAGKHVPYTHLSMFWSDIGKTNYTAVGEIDSSLRTVSFWSKINYETDGSPWYSASAPHRSSGYERGVVFYIRGDKVVGSLLWNCPEHLEKAREVIYNGKSFGDIKGELRNLLDA